MKKYLSLFIVSACMFSLSGAIALAEKGPENPDRGLFKEPREQFKQEREQLKQEREERKQINEAERESIKKEIEAKREEVKKIREEIKTQIENSREIAKQKIEDLKLKIKGEKDAVKAKLAEKRILGREEALKRFDAAILRVGTLKDKVDSIVTKHETNGLDVSVARDFILNAENKLNEAKVKTTEAYALLGTSTNQLSVEDKAKLKTLTTEIQTLIKDAHKSIGDAIKSVKETIKTKIENEKVNDDATNENEVKELDETNN